MRPAGIIFGASNILGIRYKISANIDNLFFFKINNLLHGTQWQTVVATL